MSGRVMVRLALSLAFVGGYCDAASFLLAKTFTGHVTGNFVLTTVKLATGDLRGALGSVLAITCFLLGTYLSVLLLKRLPSGSTRYFFQVTLGTEIILVVSAWFVLRSGLPLAPETFLAAVAIAMGRQNGALYRVHGVSLHTSYLTGNLTTLLIGQLAANPRGVSAPTADGLSAGKLIGGIWICFVLGALTGAIVVSQFHTSGILGAALLLVLIMIDVSRQATTTTD